MEVIIHSTLPDIGGRVTLVVEGNATVDSLIAGFCVEKGVPQSKNYILTRSAQEELLLTDQIFTCGITEGEVLFLCEKVSFEHRWPCGCNQWWVLAGVALIIGSIGIAAISLVKVNGDETIYQYGNVIDAGSSHTSFFLYRWPADKANGTGIVSQVTECLPEGKGISSYVKHPAQAGSSLTSCLKTTAREVSDNQRKHTDVFLGATAGMRLLNNSEPQIAAEIMKSVSDTLNRSVFNFTPEYARILTGRNEGCYSWVTVNYLLQTFFQTSPLTYMSRLLSWSVDTVGALDLGGASTQITFRPSPEVTMPRNASETLLLYGRNYTIYTHSYLCYGLNEAERRYSAQLVVSQNFTDVIYDSCAPLNYTRKVNVSEIMSESCTSDILPPPSLTKTFTFIGRGDPDNCSELVDVLLSNDTFDEVYQPPLYGTFQAFAGYYQIMNAFNMSGKVQLDKFRDFREKFCKKSWDEVKNLPDSAYLMRQCFGAFYVESLLDKFGFNESNWHTIRFDNQIGETAMGWSLGFMLLASNKIPEAYPNPPFTLVVFILLMILFIAFIVMALAFACHAHCSKTRPPANYRPLTTYGNT